MCVPSLQEQRQCVGSFEEDTSDNIYATLGEVYALYYLHVQSILLVTMYSTMHVLQHTLTELALTIFVLIFV